MLGKEMPTIQNLLHHREQTEILGCQRGCKRLQVRQTL